ncbi:MAG: aminoglycoside 6-N-acetyltransferase, partial [Candidatus Poribacteria bacterium]|nr:aminoglycoside 6-N-acetyltransferase [Candidatus Poribacteria bacterium]
FFQQTNSCHLDCFLTTKPRIHKEIYNSILCVFVFFMILQHEISLKSVSLSGESIKLRPMTENDWDILLKWNSDSEVLYYADGNDVTSYNLEEIQDIYRSVSQNAFCFIIEVDNKPIGECWLQKLNLEILLQEYPDQDCRRIDLMIGEKQYWGYGIGTEVIRLLTEFGFQKQGTDMIFGCHIADYNVRSLRAFQKVGYRIYSKKKVNAKAEFIYTVVMNKDEFFNEGRESAGSLPK